MAKLTYHPQFRRDLPAWLQINDFVDGSFDAVSKYLFRYSTEEVNSSKARASYHSRLQRLNNDNLCDPILSIHLAHLSQQITFGGLDSEKFQTIIADANGAGQSAPEMVRSYLWEYLKLGMIGILVDAPADPNLAKPSYQVMYPATHIRDYRRFTDGENKGEFRLVLLQDEDFRDDEGKSYERMRLIEFTDDSEFPVYTIYQSKEEKNIFDLADESRDLAGLIWKWDFLDREYDVIEEGSLSIPVIPFEIIGSGLSDSTIKDVYCDNKIILNKQSAKDNILYYQAFQRLLGAGLTPEEVASWNESIICTTTSPDAKVQVIESANPQALSEDIANMKSRAMRKGLLQHNQLIDDTRQVQSAESKEKDMKARSKYYDFVLEAFERSLSRIFAFHALFESETPESIAIKIARDYGLDSGDTQQSQDALIYSQAGTFGAREVQAEILKKHVSRMQIIGKDGQSEEERRKELLDSIDAAKSTQVSSPLNNGGFQFQRPTLAQLT